MNVSDLLDAAERRLPDLQADYERARAAFAKAAEKGRMQARAAQPALALALRRLNVVRKARQTLHELDALMREVSSEPPAITNPTPKEGNTP